MMDIFIIISMLTDKKMSTKNVQCSTDKMTINKSLKYNFEAAQVYKEGVVYFARVKLTWN